MRIWWQVDIQLYYQIFFAKHSLKYLKKDEAELNMISVFFHIQTLLTSIANISKVLQRSEEYREHLGIQLHLVPNIMDRRIRNINEHIDEQIFSEECLSSASSDIGYGSFDISELDIPTQICHFNVKEKAIQFRDKDKSYHNVRLTRIEKELRYLLKLEPIRYAYERYRGYDKIEI